MDFPLISILCPDLRSPSLGAAVRLRQLLAPYPVEIVGPDFGGGVCSMYQHEGPFTVVPGDRMYRVPEFWWQSRRIDRAVRGRLVIALKAYMNTVPVALRLRRTRGLRAGVFLDEWDGAVLSGLSRRQYTARLMSQARFPLEDAFYPFVERRIREADLVLSTTTALQRKFGGEVIAMGVDTQKFAPQPLEKIAALRRDLGLDGFRVVVFGGVVRPHKGVEQILEAMILLGREDLKFLVVGPVTDHLVDMMKDSRYEGLIQVVGAPLSDRTGINAGIHQRMADYLDLADAIILPLRDEPLARTQMPIKVFEAMAMAKPIIGSAVADLPVVLEGCGWTVPPDQAKALADALGRVLDDPAAAARAGQAARARCLERYSRDAVSRRLKALVEPLLAGTAT